MANTRRSAVPNPKDGDGENSVEEDIITVAPDRTGWPPAPSERRDFLNRVRKFPPVVSSWRRRLLARIISGQAEFPTTRDIDEEQAGERLDEGISYIREIARILALLYGTPDLGNKPDPTDELVYIILSRKTPEKAYQKTFDALKSRFPQWDKLLDAPRSEVETIVSPGGLAGKKATSLLGALTIIRSTFGSCSLEPAREWSDENLEEFLCSLPEIQKKSAYCIMMYSFGREVFPSDTHVGRVLSRLGPYSELGLELDGLDHKKLQMVLADVIPPPLRYSLHVNLIGHGRTVCRAPKPLCERCELRSFCRYYRARESVRVMATESPTVVDLFCGAGGSSEGFVRAGFKVLAALDFDKMAVKTYRFNHPGVPDDRVICQDIRALKVGMLRKLSGKKLDVLVGSPP